MSVQEFKLFKKNLHKNKEEGRKERRRIEGRKKERNKGRLGEGKKDKRNFSMYIWFVEFIGMKGD